MQVRAAFGFVSIKKQNSATFPIMLVQLTIPLSNHGCNTGNFLFVHLGKKMEKENQSWEKGKCDFHTWVCEEKSIE